MSKLESNSSNQIKNHINQGNDIKFVADSNEYLTIPNTLSELGNIAGSITITSLSSTSSSIDVSYDVGQIEGEDVHDTDKATVTAEAINSGSVVQSTSHDFKLGGTESGLSYTDTLDSLSADTSYDIEVRVDVNGLSLKQTDSKATQAGLTTLYEPANWSSMVHYWPLNSDANDAVDSLDFTVEGSPNRPSAVNNGGYGFDGTDDRLIRSSVGETDLPIQEISIAGWFELASDNTSIVLAHGDDGTEIHIAIGYSSISGTVAGFARTVNDGLIQLSGNAINLDSRTFVLLTYSKSNGRVRLYQNGSQVDSDTNASGNLDFSSAILTSGYEPNNQVYTPSKYYDELLVFNKELSSSEIDTIYQKGV